MAKDTTPLEEFRRVTATTMRAVSRKEVNVSFVPDGGPTRTRPVSVDLTFVLDLLVTSAGAR